MKNNAALVILVLAMSSVLLFNSGCNGDKLSGSGFGTIDLPSTAAPPPVLPGTSNGLLDNAKYFYVGVDTTSELISHVRSISNFSTPCGISKDSVANEDLTCLIDAPEADLHNKNLELKFNVPPGMCRYLVRKIYWFYNREVGYGPSSIVATVAKTINASGDLTGVTYSCSFDGGAADANCDNHPEISPTLAPEGQTFSCNYDKTLSEGYNCCFGSYGLSITTNTTGPGIALSETSNTAAKWGGDYINCIGGPGKTNWSHYSKENIPVGAVSYAINGITDKQIVTSALSLVIRTNIHVANYSGGAASHLHTGFVSPTTSTAPYFMAPIDDRSGTGIFGTQASYEFQCLDEAYEVKHRLRVYVRDWDAYPDYLAYIASSGATAIPDRGSDLEPGTNCSAIASAGFYCNDFYDSDDFLNLGLGGTYIMAPVTNRGGFFPFLGY